VTSEADTVDASVCILIDEWPDGYVSEWAWVKVSEVTQTPEAAIAKLQREFPVDEQGDGGEQNEYIVASPPKCWKRCVGVPDAHGVVLDDGSEYHWPEVPWEDCKEGDERAEEFWRIELIDHELNDGDDD
jgi:hypothetical protein